MCGKKLWKCTRILLFILLLLASIHAINPLKAAHAETLTYYTTSSGDDGFTYIISKILIGSGYDIFPSPQPINPIQPIEPIGPLDLFTEVFSPDEAAILMIADESSCYNWFRFRQVDVPQGAIINSAVLRVTASQASGDTTIDYLIQGFAEDNANAPTEYSDFYYRNKTSAYTAVKLSAFVANQTYSIYGLEDIIQEIVDRPGWSPQNALVICTSAEKYSSDVACYSYDGASSSTPSAAPRLDISYSIPIHDVAVTDITFNTVVTAGDNLTLSVAVANLGQAKETFDVTLFYSDTLIETQQVSDLVAGATTRLDYKWNTTGVTEGTYPIKAEASIVNGEINQADNVLLEGAVQVTVLKSPHAAFTWSPTMPQADETVYFNASLSTDLDGIITTYEWDWNGDDTYDTSVTSPIITHTFTSTGTYDVGLRVTDDDGLSGTQTASIQIAAPSSGTQPPIAEANGPYTGDVGEAIAFSAAGSSDPDGTISTYQWDFGDGTDSVSEANPSHTFTESGSYTVSLQVTDNDGTTHTDTAVCVVLEIGSVAITGTVTAHDTQVPLAGVTVTANGASDTTGSDGAYVLIVQPGTYDVVVTMNNYEKQTQSITVASGNSPALDFSMTASSSEFPLIPVIGGLGAVAAVAALTLLRRKPKDTPDPKPSALGITVDPTELFADGTSSSTVTVTLLDNEGVPIKAIDAVTVHIQSTKGEISRSITITNGQTAATATLQSSFEVGDAQVSISAKKMKGASATVSFVEKKRYCMHCGSKMQLDANRCPNCARTPPSGVDVKACPNCHEVIPTVARFCSACGASQILDNSN